MWGALEIIHKGHYSSMCDMTHPHINLMTYLYVTWLIYVWHDSSTHKFDTDIWSVATCHIKWMYIPHFLQKSPINSGSFAERNLQYQIPWLTSDLWRASYGIYTSDLCTYLIFCQRALYFMALLRKETCNIKYHCGHLTCGERAMIQPIAFGVLFLQSQISIDVLVL